MSNSDWTSFFETFDPDVFVIAFQGDVYELRPLTAELRRLVEATTALKQEHWTTWRL